MTAIQSHEYMRSKGWKDIEESTKLLYSIFPNYPDSLRREPKEVICPDCAAKTR